MNILQEVSYPELAFPDESWMHQELESGKRFCPECNRLKLDSYPAPLAMYLDCIPEEMACGLVQRMGTFIYRKDLIEALKPHLANFVIGPCYLKGRLSDWVTCYSKNRILVRSDKDTGYFTCQTCGNITGYYGDGPEYIVRSTLTDSRIYQTDCCSLCLDDDLALNIDWKRWAKLYLVPCEIWDKPIDGLPENPADWPPQTPLRLWSEYVTKRVRNAKRNAK